MPPSEDELRRLLPRSNQPGTFPKDGLLVDEHIVFETRPRTMRYRWGLFWIPIPFLGLLGLTAIVESFLLPPAQYLAGLPAFAAFMLVFALPILYAVVSARRTAYGLSDQRVLFRSGAESYGVPYERVVGVGVGGRSSQVVFQLAPLSASNLGPAAGDPGLTIRWEAVRNARSLAAFAAQAQRLFLFRNHQRALRSQVAVAQLQNKIVCQYCGGLTPIGELNPNNPRCPRCSAPLVTLPRGM